MNHHNITRNISVRALGAEVATGVNDAAGNITFDPPLEFTAPGDYQYIMKETSTDGNGWNTDTKEYPVTVHVTDEFGTLVGRVEYPEGYTLTNRYGVFAALSAEKETNIPMAAGQFKFAIVDGTNGQVIATGENIAAGVSSPIAFDNVLISATGTHQYTMLETSLDGDDPGWNLDASEYPVEVTVEEDPNEPGAMVITDITYPDDTPPVFRNTFGVLFTPQANKTINGSNTFVRAGEFTFALFDADGNEIPGTRTTNLANGTIRFPAQYLTQVGNQVPFYAGEIAPLSSDPAYNPDMTYDAAKYPIQVDVRDTNGGATPNWVIDNSNVVINNTTPLESVNVTIAAAKVAQGGVLADGQFTFALYEADDTSRTVGTARRAIPAKAPQRAKPASLPKANRSAWQRSQR